MATYCSILAWRIPWTEELGVVLQPEEGLGSFMNILTLDGRKTGSMLEVW